MGAGGRELREESETRRDGSRTCVRLRETGSGYGPGWTDGGDGHGGAEAVENERSERDGVRRRVRAVATEPPRINPPLDERRCFCDLRSATIFAHSFCAIRCHRLSLAPRRERRIGGQR